MIKESESVGKLFTIESFNNKKEKTSWNITANILLYNHYFEVSSNLKKFDPGVDNKSHKRTKHLIKPREKSLYRDDISRISYFQNFKRFKTSTDSSFSDLNINLVPIPNHVCVSFRQQCISRIELPVCIVFRFRNRV